MPAARFCMDHAASQFPELTHLPVLPRVSNDFESAVIFFVCLVAAVIFHEVSHGVVALWFGDDTTRQAGRLTLNPAPTSIRSVR